MLFQMCYGPEIKSIFEVIARQPNCTVKELRQYFQYEEQGDISSLIEGVLKFLEEIEFVRHHQGHYEAIRDFWSILDVFKQFRNIEANADENNLNYIFTTMYEHLFVRQNQMFIQDLYQVANSHYGNTLIGEEKINAWKRMMEYFGLGYRVYSGFYALPQLHLLKELIQQLSDWEGPLQILLHNKVDPIIPCVHNGQAFSGMIFGLTYLNELNLIHLSKKQDLPYNHYGEKQWNWVKVEGAKL